MSLTRIQSDMYQNRHDNGAMLTQSPVVRWPRPRMAKKAIIHFLLALVITMPLSRVQARVSHQEGEFYLITGEITAKDVMQARAIAQNMGPNTSLYFKLNSPGGDIYAAMEVGRIMRKARATCVISPASKCVSACVLVLAGAADRLVEGEVGIHRPYSTYVGKRDYQITEREYRKTEAAISSYLKEMNVPQQLFEAMVRVPPEQTRVLTGEEIAAFGLARTDPVEEEVRDSFWASRYGLSKPEYLSRKAAVDKACPPQHFPSAKRPPKRSVFNPFEEQEPFNTAEWYACRQAFLFGVPTPVYKARQKRVEELCSTYKGGSEGYGSCAGAVLRGER